ncbi:hypothetical protein DFH06DRAFT_976182 [Mycena polygramma]|nr:hypothetical protein DFH06DRAFT_976182 [Mycena polygramma]
MEKFDIQFVPGNSQIRCLAHVVNLVVQKLLHELDEAEDPETADDYVPNKDLPFHYDPARDPELIELEREVFTVDDEEVTEEDDAAGLLAALGSDFEKLSPLKRLRTTTTKICSSPQRRKRFRATAEKTYGETLAPSGRKLASLMVIRDALDIWVLEREELRPLYLKPEDWKLLEALEGVLKMFTLVTKHMSRSSTPTLPWVLPMYEGMLKHLRACKLDNSLSAKLRVAAEAGLEKLEEYYDKACQCQLNVIATLLHPSLGIAWFRKNDAEPGQHTTSAANAEVLFEHIYESYREVAASEDSNVPAPPPPRRSRPGTLGSFLDDICMADVADVAEPESTVSELARFWGAFKNYSGDPKAPLTWWKVSCF